MILVITRSREVRIDFVFGTRGEMRKKVDSLKGDVDKGILFFLFSRLFFSGVEILWFREWQMLGVKKKEFRGL